MRRQAELAVNIHVDSCVTLRSEIRRARAWHHRTGTGLLTRNYRLAMRELLNRLPAAGHSHHSPRTQLNNTGYVLTDHQLIKPPSAPARASRVYAKCGTYRRHLSCKPHDGQVLGSTRNSGSDRQRLQQRSHVGTTVLRVQLSPLLR